MRDSSGKPRSLDAVLLARERLVPFPAVAPVALRNGYSPPVSHALFEALGASS